MNRYCLDCKVLLNGRSDKKFCNDACRSNYNNKRNSHNQGYIRQVNSILKKNRNILDKLNPQGKTKVLKTELIKQGFSFKHFTHILETHRNNSYFFCYDCGYLLINEREYLLVKKEL